VVLDRPEGKPRPTSQGITAEIREDGQSYDYWALRRSGDFYLLQSLFEDKEEIPNLVFFETRIVRVAEAVLYCRRLYQCLDVDPETSVRMTIKHCGLKGRELRAAGRDRRLVQQRVAIENEIERIQLFQLAAVDADLMTIVKGYVAPLFELFEFCTFEDQVYSSVLNKFVSRVRR